jgi:hypothetical protein
MKSEHKVKEMQITYLHDELNGTDEEAEELENQVLLLLLHLVKTILATASGDFGLSQTNARVGLEHVLGDNTTTSGLSLLLLVEDITTLLWLEVLNESVNVLILLLFVGDGLLGSLGGRSGSLSGALLVEATGLDGGVERGGRADILVVSHGELETWWKQPLTSTSQCASCWVDEKDEKSGNERQGVRAALGL